MASLKCSHSGWGVFKVLIHHFSADVFWFQRSVNTLTGPQCWTNDPQTKRRMLWSFDCVKKVSDVMEMCPRYLRRWHSSYYVTVRVAKLKWMGDLFFPNRLRAGEIQTRCKSFSCACDSSEAWKNKNRQTITRSRKRLCCCGCKIQPCHDGALKLSWLQQVIHLLYISQLILGPMLRFKDLNFGVTQFERAVVAADVSSKVLEI